MFKWREPFLSEPFRFFLSKQRGPGHFKLLLLACQEIEG